MEIIKIDPPSQPMLDRIYVASAMLANFRGQSHVETQIFRHGFDEGEVEAIRNRGLVGKPDPAMPPELIAGATEDAALRCILEAFTEAEIDALASYLEKRYGDQIEKLVIAPLDLPAPLGVGPLAGIPEGGKSGFINFDKAPGYDLPFAIKAYYDLDAV